MFFTLSNQGKHKTLLATLKQRTEHVIDQRRSQDIELTNVIAKKNASNREICLPEIEIGQMDRRRLRTGYQSGRVEIPDRPVKPVKKPAKTPFSELKICFEPYVLFLTVITLF